MKYVRSLVRFICSKLGISIPIWALPKIGEMKKKIGDY